MISELNSAISSIKEPPSRDKLRQVAVLCCPVSGVSDLSSDRGQHSEGFSSTSTAFLNSQRQHPSGGLYWIGLELLWWPELIPACLRTASPSAHRSWRS